MKKSFRKTKHQSLDKSISFMFSAVLPDEEECLVMALPIFSYHSTVLERDTAAVP